MSVNERDKDLRQKKIRIYVKFRKFSTRKLFLYRRKGEAGFQMAFSSRNCDLIFHESPFIVYRNFSDAVGLGGGGRWFTIDIRVGNFRNLVSKRGSLDL